jgi:monovalent cation:H+ antiporter-2, CPA2 family
MALDPSSSALSDALVVLGAAGLIIPAFARLRISPVIGFILCGVVVGPFGLGALVDDFPWLFYVTISDPPAMAVLGEIGIILLLFSVGLELGVQRLVAMRREIAGIGSAELLGNGALIALVLWLAGYSVNAALGLGLALAISSTALVLPIAGSTSSRGKPAFAMLLFEDIALVPIIFLLGVLGTGARDLSALGANIGLGLAVVIGLFLAGKLVLPRLFAQAARTKSPELFLCVALLVVILASIATMSVGLSTLMGALIAGMVIAESRYGEEVRSVIAPFMNLALGVFLLTIGMGLPLPLLAERFGEIIAAVCGILIIKALFTALLLRASGTRTGVAAEVGILMASPSELTLVLLGTAVAANLIAPDTAAFWSAVTALGLTITPLLARIGRDVSRRIESGNLDELDEPTAPDAPPRVILIGYGRVGRMVGDMLSTHGRPYIAIEADVDAVADARAQGRPVRLGDAARATTLDSLSLELASAVVLTMDDPVQAVRLTHDIRARVPSLTIIARARDPDHAAELYRAGASDAVPETLESSLQLSEAVLVDLGVAMGPVIASIHEKRDELRHQIKLAGEMDRMPRLRRSGRSDILESK